VGRVVGVRRQRDDERRPVGGGPSRSSFAGAAGRATRGERRRRGHGRQGRVGRRAAAGGGVVGVPAVRGSARAVPCHRPTRSSPPAPLTSAKHSSKPSSPASPSPAPTGSSPSSASPTPEKKPGPQRLYQRIRPGVPRRRDGYAEWGTRLAVHNSVTPTAWSNTRRFRVGAGGCAALPNLRSHPLHGCGLELSHDV
jgi:hypothetical protein